MVSAFAVSMLRLRLLALWDRLRAYVTPRASEPVTPLPDFIAIAPTLARDVSRRSVRFFTLCAACGARLEASATLCESCAARRSREPWV